MKKIGCVILVILIMGCGYVGKSKEAGKDLAEDLKIGNPLEEADIKESLLEARDDVERSKHEYQKCLKRNSGNESACTKLKAEYEESTERYIEIQKN